MRIICVVGFVAMLLTGVVPAQAGLESDLVAHYAFDGTPNDSSGNQLHGVENGGVTYEGGVFGQAASFDGVNDYVEVPDSPLLRFGTGDFTVALWVRFDDLQDGGNGLFCKDTYGGDPPPITATGTVVNIDDDNGGVGFLTRDLFEGTGPVTDSRLGTSGFAAGAWYHLAAVRDANLLRLFVNGQLRESASEQQPTDISNSSPLLIGRVNVSPQWFGGLIDDLRVYSRALSEGEIENLYTGQCNPCDANGDGQVNALDLQKLVNVILGVDVCTP